MELIVALIVGILVGGGACWLAQEWRTKSRLAKVDLEHQKTVAEHREIVAGLRGQLEQGGNIAEPH